MRPRPEFARTWFHVVVTVWWNRFIALWDDVASAMKGEYFPVEDRSWGDVPDAPDAHVDFGGGDE